MRNFIPHFIQEKLLEGNIQGQFKAYTMYIDLSGFTPLTETLMSKGTPGAEQLSVVLNNIFGPMVQTVYQKNGFIPYFAGDAITAIFPEHTSGVEALDLLWLAQNLERHFTDENHQKTQFGDFEIGIKIRLSFGDVNWGIVGNKLKTFYFRGSAIDNPCQDNAVVNEQGILFDQFLFHKFKKEHLPDLEVVKKEFYRLKRDLLPPKNEIFQQEIDPLKREILSQFLPTSILDFNQEGEFREVTSIFITFKGVGSHQQINKFASIVLDLVDTFSGYFKEIDFGDKGGMMVVFFGAPVSYENNVDRALEFITALHKDTQDLQHQSELTFRAGISEGLAYTGIVGGKERCQYAVVGNRVNLAARLMTQAEWGYTRVDEQVSRNRNFEFIHIGDTQYKGIKKDIPTYQLSGRSQEYHSGFTSKMVGRATEKAQIIDIAQPIFKGQFAGIACLYGEAGIGKSRLAYEIKQTLLDQKNVHWLNCASDQILKKPFNPFVSFLKDYFQQSPESSNDTNRLNFDRRYRNLLSQLECIEKQEASIVHKELTRTKSILAALLSISLPNSLWDQLDAKGRYQNILESLSVLFIAESLIQPIVIELEDGHWFDNSSREFLNKFANRIRQHPIFILTTSRYLDDGSKPQLFTQEVLEKNHIQRFEIDLSIFSKESLLHFVESKLNGKVSEELLSLLQRTTNGNPFYLEQVIEYFKESHLLKLHNQKWHIKDTNIKVSGSISAILMARIDRLSILVKETVKAAAVIGREFDIPILSEIMKENKEFSKFNGNKSVVLREQIQTAEKVQIWLAMNELRYIFRHSLLRETVYGMQMNTRLKELHGLIAKAIEGLYADNLKEKYVDLAFHFEQAQQEEKTREYLEKAANHARGDFQNEQALEFYTRLLPRIKDKSHRLELLLQKAKVLELIGQWDECNKELASALKLANTESNQLLLGRINNRIGKLSMLKGNYEKALDHFTIAQELFESIKDNIGISKVNGNLGNLYFRQGNYPKANDYFYKSLEYSRSEKLNISNANIVSHLGLAYMNQGEFEKGIEGILEELRHCKNRNDKQGMATLYTNLGIVYFEKGDSEQSLRSYEKGLAFAEELGNKQLTSIAIGCIGSVYQQQGDYTSALKNFLIDLQICEEMGDKQGIAIALGLLGELRSVEGEFDLAKEYLENAIRLGEELGYQKGIAKSANNLGDIYTFQKDFPKAIAYYDQAIRIARRINNQLVLGFSLVEKSEVLVKMKQFDEALKIQNEANTIAQNLGNPDLLFQAALLTGRLKNHTEGPSEAMDFLLPMLYQDVTLAQRADIFFELSFISEGITDYQETALNLYRRLYEETPKYVYLERVKILEQ